MRKINCKNCAAPVHKNKDKCPYCGSYYQENYHKDKVELSPNLRRLILGFTPLIPFLVGYYMIKIKK